MLTSTANYAFQGIMQVTEQNSYVFEWSEWIYKNNYKNFAQTYLKFRTPSPCRGFDRQTVEFNCILWKNLHIHLIQDNPMNYLQSIIAAFMVCNNFLFTFHLNLQVYPSKFLDAINILIYALSKKCL